MDINLYRGDTGDGRRAKLIDKNGPVDLTDADVRFLFGPHEIYPIKENIGELLVVFESIHTSEARVFHACFKVTFKDGRKETHPGPDEQRIKVRIKEC